MPRHYSIPETSGIYKITCIPTGKFYIGSSVNLYHRSVCHFSDLLHNVHKNPKLQAAFNKYGPDAFVFEVLELVLPAFQVEREQHWLDSLQPFDKKGFNINRTANKPTFTPETCEKIRLAKLGHTVSAESRASISAKKTGHKYAPEVYTKRMKTLIVTAPDGTECVITGIRQFCKEHNLDVSSLMRVAKSPSNGTVYTQHKGYKARFVGTDPQEFKPLLISSETRSDRAKAQKKTLIVTDPTGIEYVVCGISQFAKIHNLNRTYLVLVARGKWSHHKGWTARFPD